MCGPSREVREIIWSSALALTSALLLSPWLELVIIPATLLAASSLVAYRCASFSPKIEITRKKIRKKDIIHVYLSITNYEDFTISVKVIDLLNTKEIMFEESLGPKARKTFEYVVDLRSSDIIFSPGLLTTIKAKGCECIRFVDDVMFNVNLKGKGFIKVIESEGNEVTVPEIQGVKEYRPGDDLRLIVWKSLGKVGGLRVKELARVSETIKSGIEELRRFKVVCNEWCENTCIRRIIEGVVNELREMGLEEGEGELVVIPPGATFKRAQLVLLINPEACIIEVPFAKKALREVKRTIRSEVENYVKKLRSKNVEVIVLP